MSCSSSLLFGMLFRTRCIYPLMPIPSPGVWQLTAKSAYDAQFIGRIREPDLNRVWKMQTEGKVRFYYFLALQNKKLDGWQAFDDPICKLCDQQPETAVHLLLLCPFPFARQIWADLSVSDPQVSVIGSSSTSVAQAQQRHSKAAQAWMPFSCMLHGLAYLEGEEHKGVSEFLSLC